MRLIDADAAYARACKGCACRGSEIGTCYEAALCPRLHFEFVSAEAVAAVPLPVPPGGKVYRLHKPVRYEYEEKNGLRVITIPKEAWLSEETIHPFMLDRDFKLLPDYFATREEAEAAMKKLLKDEGERLVKGK